MSEMLDEEAFTKKIAGTLSPAVGKRQNNAFLVAGKWALRARQLQTRPDNEQLQLCISTAWKWVKMKKQLPKNMRVDPKMEILEHLFGHIEKRLQLTLYSLANLCTISLHFYKIQYSGGHKKY